MSDDLRTRFYNVRNRLDKERPMDAAIGDASARRYIDLMPDVRGMSVLDAGFGTGWMTDRMALQGPRVLYGIDVSSDRVRELKERFGPDSVPHYFITGSVETLEFLEDETIDFINCRDVVEHLTDYNCRRCLAEFLRVLRPGGCLMLQTPNGFMHEELQTPHFVHAMLERILSGQDSGMAADDPLLAQGSQSLTEEEQAILEEVRQHDVHEHEHLFAPLEFRELLHAAGFEVTAAAGTPPFAAVFHQLGPHMPRVSGWYLELVTGEWGARLLEALQADLVALGRLPEGAQHLPIDYLFGDDLILKVRKPESPASVAAPEEPENKP